MNDRCSSDITLANLGLLVSGLSVELRDFLIMYYIRKVELKIATEYPFGFIRTPVHLCVGQEAIPAGVSKYLFSQDKIFSNHRSHGHYLAKGGSLESLFSELLGRKAGCARGRGGSQHLIDLQSNFIASAPILGGTVPIATGAAFSQKLNKLEGIVVVYLGDAVLEEGVLYESLSFASFKSLPILFVVENNRLSVHTYIQDRQPIRKFSDIGKAFGLESFESDGNDISKVSSTAEVAIDIVRREGKPVILFFETYRQFEHVGPSQDFELGYRSSEEDEIWQMRDPLEIAKFAIQDTSVGESFKKNQSENLIDNYIISSWNNAFKSREAIL